MRSRSLSAARETFVVASYTVLATASIQPERYPRTPALILHPTWRRAALVHHMVSLDATILYLQEVKRETFAALQARLGPLGYAAHCAQKGGGRPDGCVILYRKALSTVPDVGVLAYADGQRTVADADHIALFVLLRAADRLLGITNTHLAWPPPDTPREAQRGYRQITELLTTYARLAVTGQGWLLCGDLNVTPGSAGVAALEGLAGAIRTLAWRRRTPVTPTGRPR